MKVLRRRSVLFGALAAAALALLLAFAFRGPLSRAVVAAALDASGYTVAFRELQMRAGFIALGDVTVERGSERLLSARSITVRYDLRDLLPGAAQRGALRDVFIENAVLTLVRHPDGSFNLAGGGAPAAPSGPAGNGRSGAPLRFSLQVTPSRIVLLDPSRVLPGSRRIELDRFSALGYVDTGGESVLSARGRLSTAGAAGPGAEVTLRARDEALRGFFDARVRAADVPLRDVVNYFINSPTAAVLTGDARNLDVRAYALDLNASRPSGYHLVGGAMLAGASMNVPGLRVPLRNLAGRFDLFDTGLATPQARGDLGGIGVRLAGGLYDWSALHFRLGLRAEGDLERVRTLFTFARRLPLSGGVAVRGLVEGPVSSPLVSTTLSAASMRYDRFPLHDVTGDALFYESTVALAPVAAGYGPVRATVRGTLDLGAVAASRLVVDASAQAASLPYLAQVVPGAPLRVTGIVLGSDLALEARGVFAGAGQGDRVAGTFHIDRSGDGLIGPLQASRADGTSLAGAYYSNRIASESGFWLDARDFALTRIDPPPGLPGLPALVPPQLSARLNARLAGEGTPADFRLAGAVSGGALSLGTLHIDAFSGSLAGDPDDVRLAGLRASGPWGAFDGEGGYAGGALALRGNYAGTFERLSTLTGDLGAHGNLHGPVTLLVAGDRTVVQAGGVSSPGALVHGVPIDGLRGTVAVTGKRLQVYAASADVAGGSMVAAGGLGPGQSLGVSVAGADARRLSATGLSLQRGGIDAIGTVRQDGPAGAPSFVGGVALVRGQIRHLDVAADASVRADPSRVDLSAAGVLAGPAYGTGAGYVTGFGGGKPAYALTVDARDVPAAPFARMFAPKRHDIVGLVDAGFSAQGRGTAVPHVRGTVEVPEGSFNGQAFRAGRLSVDAQAGNVAARDGSLVVGTTALTFGALVRGRDVSLHFVAPQAELSDFDDLFDTGDTLGGRGSVSIDFAKNAGAIRTSGGADVLALRYRRFDLGDTTAKWTSAGRTVDAKLAFGGPSGQLAAAGTFALAAQAPLDKLLQRSSFVGTATLKSLDLGTWLPVLGYQLPIAGRIDATATVSGALVNPVLHADAVLVGGVLGTFPVSRAQATFDAGLTGADIRSANFQLSGLSLTGSGRLGFGESDPLQLSLHGTTPNIGELTGRFFATKLRLSGTGEADVKVAGTRGKPKVAGGFDIEKAALNGVAFPRVLGQFSLDGRNVVVSGAEVNFTKGALLLAGSVPFTVSPFAFGPAESPVALDVSADGIDLTNFAPLLPGNSTLAGRLDGRVAIGGTAGNPVLDGDLTLAGGAVTSPFETVPVTDLSGKLTFTGNVVKLEALHLAAGGGAFDAQGSATLPDLVHPGADASYAFNGKAKALHLDIPALGRGQIDGTLAVTHQPGSPPLISSDATLQDAVIPFSALLLAGGGATSGGGGPSLSIPSETSVAKPTLALAVKVAAGNNVRVRSGNVDIGARGSLDVDGTLADPQLTGKFTSTGGTLAYFNRVFRVQSGTVTFSPDQGVIPTLDAVATAHVSNSDPNSVRNPSGTADVQIDVKGPINNLNIQLSSDPSYDREQILGLLLGAPAIGATNIFDAQTPGQQLSVAGTQPAGTTTNRNGEFSVGQQAFSLVNAQFTRTLLAPFETAFGDALGLSSFNVNIDYGGGVGLSARKILGRNVNFIYATSFAYPYRQTFGFDIKPNPSTVAQVTVFQTIGAYSFGQTTGGSYLLNPLQPVNSRATAAQPSSGTVGFSVSLQRLFR